MTKKSAALSVLAIAALVGAPDSARAADTSLRQVSITASSPAEAVRWYVRHMECEALPDRKDTARCGEVELVFLVQPTQGGSQGTGINHIGFSFPNLSAKMAALEKVGVQGSGVRLQRFPDGSTVREVPGLFKIGFIFDPWGTRIELVEDAEYPGFHHVHLSAANPETTLAWYRDTFGGKPASLKGSLNGLLFNRVWLLASRHEEGAPAATRGRAIDHLTFASSNLDETAAQLRTRKVSWQTEPAVPKAGRTAARRGFIDGPDKVVLAVVETAFAGVETERSASAAGGDPGTVYTTPKTPWGEPDLQGIWTGNSAQAIPLERPLNQTELKALTPEEAEARHERGTLASIWGYEREWRDTTLGYVKTAPSTQVAMVIDPPDGRIPPMTAEGQRRAEEARRQAATEETASGGLARLPQGPEDLSSWVRCITRGLPGMMIPSVYNNGLQIVQGPGFVAIQKEMIHETRVIPTRPRPRSGPALTSWLGESQGRWEGDTLVIETANFDGRGLFRGASANLKMVERYTRRGPNALEYRFTVDDPTIWTKPWTAMFTFDRDDEQYELVEYACHEGNYGMTNILSGARAQEKGEAKPAK
jgi:catechol 2,3-dioxygenase-like lactoylglutathione lyase family enzyme